MERLGGCPRCGKPVGIDDPWCGACGMGLAPPDEEAFVGSGSGFGTGAPPKVVADRGRAPLVIGVAVLVMVLAVGGLFLFAPRNDPPPGQALDLSVPNPFDVVATALDAGGTPGPQDVPPANPADPLDWSNWPEIGVAPATPAGWISVNDPDAGFTVDLPAAPTVSELETVERGRQYVASDAAAIAVVSWFPASPDTALSVQERLETSVATLVPPAGSGSSAETTPVRLKGYPALRLRITGQENTTAVCALKARNIVCAGMSGVEIDAAHLGAVVNSLRFA